MKLSNLFALILLLFFAQCLSAQTVITLDSTFGINGELRSPLFSNISPRSTQALLQPDGKILSLGYSTAGAGQDPRITLVRHKTDGTLDSSFNNLGCVHDIHSEEFQSGRFALQSNGKIVISLGFTYFAASNNIMTRFNTDGSIDSTFGINSWAASPAVDDYYNTFIKILPNDKILIVATVHETQVSQKTIGVMRFQSNGAIDSTFGNNGIVIPFPQESIEITDLIIQSDGSMLFLGNFPYVTGGIFDAILTKVDSLCMPDNSFGTNGMVYIDLPNTKDLSHSLDVQSNGKIIVALSCYDNSIGENKIALIRYNVDGTIDNSFNGTGILYQAFSGFPQTDGYMLVQPDDKILLYGNAPKTFFRRLSKDGLLDSTFYGIGEILYSELTFYYFDYSNKTFTDVFIQPDGKIISLRDNFSLERRNEDGTFDNTFHQNGRLRNVIVSGDEEMVGFSLLPNGKMIGYGAQSVARYTPDGELDETFGEYGIKYHSAFPYFPGDVVNLNDGRLIIGGTNLDYEFQIHILTSNGDYNNQEVHNDLNNQKNDWLKKLAEAPNGDLIAAGLTTAGNNNYITMVAYKPPLFNKLDSTFGGDGIAILSFPGDAILKEMLIQPDGKILIAGTIATVNDHDSFIARVKTNGTLDMTFGTNGIIKEDSSNLALMAMALQPDGKIIILETGPITSPNYLKTFIKRYNTDGTFDMDFVHTQLNQWGGIITSYLDCTGAICFQPDGKILVTSQWYQLSGTSKVAIERYNDNGILDTTFYNPAYGYPGYVNYITNLFPSFIAFHPNGKILIAGGIRAEDDYRKVHEYDQDFGFLRINTGIAPLCNDYITSSPQNQTTYSPNAVSFQVLTTTSPLNASYQWQSYLNGAWEIIQDNWQYEGTNTDSLILHFPYAANDNQQFRCIVNFATCSDTSSIANVTVFPNAIVSPIINQSPFILYPNPINQSATLAYKLYHNEIISLRLMDVYGRMVAVFKENEEQQPGEYQDNLTFPATLPQSNYWLQISVSGKIVNIPFLKQ